MRATEIKASYRILQPNATMKESDAYVENIDHAGAHHLVAQVKSNVQIVGGQKRVDQLHACFL